MKYCRCMKMFLAPQFYKGFTLMEMLISMTVIGILMAASAPLITQFSTQKTGVDKNVMKCITNNSVANPDASVWYTVATGVTSIPAAGTACNSAVVDTQYNRGKALNTATWYAKNGSTADLKTMAKRILRAACDQGGVGACDYFINSCWSNGAGVAPYCDDISDFSDVTYYLHQSSGANVNTGAIYISEQLEGILTKMIPNLLNEVIYACANNQTPNYNQNLNSNLACNLIAPQLYIKACTLGNIAACEYAYDHNYNRSCTQIKTNWSSAPTENYQLTSNGDPGAPSNTPTRQVYCNMTSLPAAAISGCNANPYVSGDCTVGYNSVYNRSCSGIFTYLLPPEDGNYNLTSNGAPPTAPVATNCFTNSACIAQGPGTICDDGTMYGGQMSDGDYIFTTPQDELGTYTWATQEALVFLGAADANNGVGNTGVMLSASDAWSPYRAAEACDTLNTSLYLGKNDWYLPANNELNAVLLNAEIIGNYTLGSWYWSSTESTSFSAIQRKKAAGGAVSMQGYQKSTIYGGGYVRCIRKSASPDASCAAIGNVCSDDSVYAAIYNGWYLFTPKIDTAQTTWNNGATGFYFTNATNLSNGQINYTVLTTAPAINNADAPFPAENACKNLNTANAGAGTSYNGGTIYYNDWYLPARNELSLLCTYKNIGAFPTVFNPFTYWTSTECDISQAYYLNFGSCGSIQISKSYVQKVHCIRRM